MSIFYKNKKNEKIKSKVSKVRRKKSQTNFIPKSATAVLLPNGKILLIGNYTRKLEIK